MGTLIFAKTQFVRRDDWLLLLLLRNYRVCEGAQAFNGDGDGFAGLEPAFGVAAEAYAGGRAGGDDVAGEKRRDGRQIFNKLRDFENQFARVGVL